MRYKAVLFDMDGTLLNTLQDIVESTNQALADMGFPLHNTDDYRYFVGEGREKLAYRALPADKRGDETFKKILDLIDLYYNRYWNNHTHPYSGIPELLDYLKDRNIKMAVLSNKPQDFTEKAANVLLSAWRFEIIKGAQKDIPKKPHPAAALNIAEQLGIDPVEIVFIGDSNIDMKTAAAAGMYAIGAGWGFRTREELIESGASAIADNPSDVIAIINK
jgi:phosphoglycolate phosphatase